MRFVVLVLALAFPAAGVLAADAFNRAEAAPRAIGVEVVGDAAAYLSIAAYAPNPHACVVTTSGGIIAIAFSDCMSGGGTGMNPGSDADAGNRTTYWFHDLLVVTNKGTKPILVWVNATTTSAGGSAVTVGRHADPGQMTTGLYSASSGAMSLAAGHDLFVGVGLHGGSLAGGSVTGALRFTARLD
ncbi:MAG TPA: hypothetical protein VM889_00035 [Candidatus Thermoplasmatota archaeon]|nr:hypothetical protein [Candidatus Thermoplasmatota archaeon]